MTLRIKGKDVGLQRCLNGLDRLIESAQELDIRLVVENSSSTAYLVPIQDLLSREIDFNLDIGHWFKGGRGYDELNHLVKDIGHRVVLLHLHDTKYQATPAKDRLPLGQGDIDFPRVFSILKGSGIQWIDLETISSEQDVLRENLTKAKKLASLMQGV